MAPTLLDVQWTTPHLESLGAVDVPRDEYLELLAAALDRAQPDVVPGRRAVAIGILGRMAATEPMVVYHNPVCSKSRGAVEILRDERGADIEVIEYLKELPTRADLERILDAIPDEPSALVRKDKRFKELGLDAADYQTKEQVVAVLLEHPELMERPVVFRRGRPRADLPPEREGPRALGLTRLRTGVSWACYSALADAGSG